MPEQNPLEPFLDQISEFLKTYEENREQKLTGSPSSKDIAELMNILSHHNAQADHEKDRKHAERYPPRT